MDIGQYQKDRESELSAFRKEYGDLKQQYSRILRQAAYETDTGKQVELVKQVLSTNSELAARVRAFVKDSNGKFDPTVISKLTSDIMRYQREFAAINQAANKTKMLQDILNEESDHLDTIQSQFNLWLGSLAVLIVIILILIFRTSLLQWTAAAESLASSISTPETGTLAE